MARIAPSLAKLRDQVNAWRPKRSKRSDGWIGDPAHATRVSDHNPDKRGIVHALDLTNLPSRADDYALINMAKKDPRTKYIIHDGIIWSETYGYKAREYTGSNAHKQHTHYSVGSSARDEAGGAWALPGVKVAKRKGVIYTSHVRKQALGKKYVGRSIASTKRVQRALNALHGAKLMVDGRWGAKTGEAFRRFVIKEGIRKTVSHKAKTRPTHGSIQRLVGSRYTVKR